MSISNFKNLENANLEFEQHSVLVGANNSGKTTALQAIYTWYALARAMEQVLSKTRKGLVEGIELGKGDLFAVPVRSIDDLWTNQVVYHDELDKKNNPVTRPVPLSLTASCRSGGEPWSLGFALAKRMGDRFHCKPIVSSECTESELIDDIRRATEQVVIYVPPFSAIREKEIKIESSAIESYLLRGSSGEIIRNLCHTLFKLSPADWDSICRLINSHFGESVLSPQLIRLDGTLEVSYETVRRVELELASAGSGILQALFLLTCYNLFPGSVILLDEPDSHLEPSRHVPFYDLLTQIADKKLIQTIVTTHSPAITSHSANSRCLIEFNNGEDPQPVTSNKQLKQQLAQINNISPHIVMQYRKHGWVLYVEGESDYTYLLRFAQLIEHRAYGYLVNCIYDPLGCNDHGLAIKRFSRIRQALTNLRGIVLFDKLKKQPGNTPPQYVMWGRHEIENYILVPNALCSYARRGDKGREDMLFPDEPMTKRGSILHEVIMKECIKDLAGEDARNDSKHKHWKEVKGKDWLNDLFLKYFSKIEMPHGERIKEDVFSEVIGHIPIDEVDLHVVTVLDMIADVAEGKPVSSIKL